MPFVKMYCQNLSKVNLNVAIKNMEDITPTLPSPLLRRSDRGGGLG